MGATVGRHHSFRRQVVARRLILQISLSQLRCILPRYVRYADVLVNFVLLPLNVGIIFEMMSIATVGESRAAADAI